MMANGSTRTTKIPHGENRGYQAHYRLGIPIDDVDTCGCRKAHADYVAKARGGVPRMSPARERDLIRSRAYKRLAREFPVAFRTFLQKESDRRRIELLKQENQELLTLAKGLI